MALPIPHPDAFVFKLGSQSYDLAARTHLMGILNITPDSFSDGGKYFDTGRAVARGEEMIEEGADILDVGGESTRPGSDPLSVEEELKRVLPVVRELAKRTHLPISIDTYKSEVAEAALDAGAVIVNDISGLTFDPGMPDVVHRHEACVILMHVKGTPKTMQENPVYEDVVGEVTRFLAQQSERARNAGISKIIVDPGIGFGKNLEHNIQLLKQLRRLTALGRPVLVGPSRKSFIGKLLDARPEDRMEGTAAAVTASILRGANIVRVHDVKQMKKVAT
ncbi:MAG TPA: dihydropteroate synthase, partial [Bacteroidota bacterium]